MQQNNETQCVVLREQVAALKKQLAESQAEATELALRLKYYQDANLNHKRRVDDQVRARKRSRDEDLAQEGPKEEDLAQQEPEEDLDAWKQAGSELYLWLR
jgi:hypothetical protein